LRPDEAGVVFFVDASLGRRIVPVALREAGFEVVAHDDRFPPGCVPSPVEKAWRSLC
jgi:hypothetical protein